MKSTTNKQPQNNRSQWLYGRIQSDRLTEVLSELLNEEPDYNAILADLAGCSMSDWERGEYSVDDSGDDLGDNLN